MYAHHNDVTKEYQPDLSGRYLPSTRCTTLINIYDLYKLPGFLILSENNNCFKSLF